MHAIRTLDLGILKEPNLPPGLTKVKGFLFFNGLTSANGLVLPKEIVGDLYLNNLASATGLVLTVKISGNIHLYSLPSEEKEKLRQRYPQHADKIE